MAKQSNQDGFFLVEVVIASTILAYGILSMLHVFTGAIHQAARARERTEIRSLADKTYMNWLLDPSSFLDEPDTPPEAAESKRFAFETHLDVQPMQSDEAEIAPEEPDPRRRQPVRRLIRRTAEFYNTDFLVRRKTGDEIFRMKMVLYRYGTKQSA